MDSPSFDVSEVDVRAVRREDLPSLSWSGSAVHLEHVAAALERADSGEVDLLALWLRGVPVSMGGVDHVKSVATGYLWMLATDPRLQGHGLGTLLVQALEDRARTRGAVRGELGVEEGNPRARRLYQRLGYQAVGREEDSWLQPGADGLPELYRCWCTVMVKHFPAT